MVQYPDNVKESAKVVIAVPAVSVSSTSASAPTQLFGVADPLLSKGIVRKIYAFNADSIAHTIIVGTYNTQTSTFTPYVVLPVSAGSNTALEPSYVPSFYSEGPVVIAAYLGQSVSTAAPIVSLEVELSQ